jgi:hypothetical protein
MTAVFSRGAERSSDFDEWSARDYLAEYYGSIMDDERYALAFLVESMRGLEPVRRALDFGCGPCVHHCFALVPRAGEIDVADFVPGNLDEIARWQERRRGAHDWSTFTAETLALEGVAVTAENIARREEETRSRLTRRMIADVRTPDPLGLAGRAAYDLVTSHYCAEAISTDKAVYRSNVCHLAGMVAPGGTLVLSACGAATSYKVGERQFPCSGVTGEDVLAALIGAGFREVDLRVRSTPAHTQQGYASVIFARARRPRE